MKPQTIVITGGAGFLGSHLVDRYAAEGWTVWVVDDLSTGCYENILHMGQRPSKVYFQHADAGGIGATSEVSLAVLEGRVPAITRVALLASPASPDAFVQDPLKCLRAGGRAVDQWLELANASGSNPRGARVLFASTSEVYGDPERHPQDEGYNGNVDPLGVRGCYDEAKRYGEALCAGWRRHRGLDTRVVRIFNTYGPRMPRDGRVMPAFIEAAINGRPFPVQGTGEQTRSFSYVSDTVQGLYAALEAPRSPEKRPPCVNVGGADEVTVYGLSRLVAEAARVDHDVRFHPARPGDPLRRRPDLSKLREIAPEIVPGKPLEKGIEATLAWASEFWK